MREILFKGKRVDNGEWVEGYVYEHQPPLQCIVPREYTRKSKFYICNTAFADWHMPRRVEFIEVIPETIGQYIGLKDKNGIKIFEGDVVHCISQYDNANMAVIFEDGEFRMVFANKLPQYETGMGFFAIHCFNKEIVGNIHDNPNLLESEE